MPVMTMMRKRSAALSADTRWTAGRWCAMTTDDREDAEFAAYMAQHFPGTASEAPSGAPETIGTAPAGEDPVDAEIDAQEDARVDAYLAHHRMTGS